MKKKRIRREIYNNDYIGVVEDINDPKRIGRARVRVESLHGRKEDKNFIPTSDLPWLEPSSRGSSFTISSVGKVVYVAFEDEDYYKGSYFAEEHYDINLQGKLDSLSDTQYSNFYALNFDAKHQYYHNDDEGVVFDYMKSNINMRENGDIRLNLKDNSSTLYLGTQDASQQAVLGNHFFDWMDELVQTLLSESFIGNLGAPVIPSPTMIEKCQKYLALRSTFLSNHVYVVDNSRVKPQTRKFDVMQFDDNWNIENMDKVNKAPNKLDTPIDRVESGGNPDNGNVPNSNFSNNLSSSVIGDNPTQDDLLKTRKPFSEAYDNGNLPVEKLTSSKYLFKSFPSDERQYLLDSPSKKLDEMIDFYNKVKKAEWNDIIVTKGYQNFERQKNTKKIYPLTAPQAGKDPFGWANQVELYFGVDRSNTDMVDAIKDYLQNNIINPNNETFIQVEVLDWLVQNSKIFGWKLAGKTSFGALQWWHWIYSI